MWWYHPKKICRCSSRNDHLISHMDTLSRCLTTAETQAQAVTVTGESESVSETKTVTTKAETVATERSRRDTSSNRSIDHRRVLLLTMDSLGRSFQRRWRGEPRAEQRGLRIELAFSLVVLQRERRRRSTDRWTHIDDLRESDKVEMNVSKRCEDGAKDA